MTSSEAFPNLGGTVNAGPAHEYSDIVSTGWYTPGTYAYQEPFMQQYPTSTVDNQSWSMSRLSIPELGIHQYAMPQQQQYQYAPLPSQVKDLSRPRSSPSTFGPGTEQMAWPMNNALGIWSTGGQPTPPTTSTFPPSVFQTYTADEQQYTASTPPEIRQPVPKRPFTTIAPNPDQVAAQKRKREEEEQQESSLSSSKKRKRTSSVASADLSEDDRFLVQLKEDEGLPWKDIVKRFESDRGLVKNVAALQMRYKRLREKYRQWEDKDVDALKRAHEYWEKNKWEIISLKMVEYSGSSERWPAKHCAKKFHELETAAVVSMGMGPSVTMTPALTHSTHYSSPVEGVPHFGGFMPHLQ